MAYPRGGLYSCDNCYEHVEDCECEEDAGERAHERWVDRKIDEMQEDDR